MGTRTHFDVMFISTYIAGLVYIFLMKELTLRKFLKVF